MMPVKKIKFLESGETVRFSEKGIKVLRRIDGIDLKTDQEFTVEKVLNTFFDGIQIYQIVKLQQFKTIFATGWLELPYEIIPLEEVKEKMPELIQELEKVNGEIDEIKRKIIEKKLRSFFSSP